MHTILLVDDNEAIRCSLEVALEQYYEVVLKDSAENALEYLNTSRSLPELIITDYKMGRMNGVEFARCVRGLFPDIPLMLMSADAGRLGKEGSYFARILEKPFGVDEFRRAISEVLKNRKAA